jgi:hypothetical protein
MPYEEQPEEFKAPESEDKAVYATKLDPDFGINLYA